MDASQLIERYVEDVGRHLPRTRRADIEAELRLLLEEELASRLAEDPAAEPNRVAAELIERFGRPEAAAARYSGTRRRGLLTRPDLLKVFGFLVAIHVLIFLTNATFLADQAGGWSALPSDPALGGLATTLLTNLLISFGALLIFGELAVLTQDRIRARWSAASLKTPAETERAGRPILIVAIAALTAAGLALLVAPELVARAMSRGATGGDAQIGAQIIQAYLPWLAAIVAGWILLAAALYRLRRGRTRGLLWAAAGLKLLTIAFFVHLLAIDATADTALFSQGIRIALYFGLAAAASEVAIRIARLFAPRAPIPAH